MLKKYETELVDTISTRSEIKDGVIYYSEQTNKSIHLCPCDCGEKVMLIHMRQGWKSSIDSEGEISISTIIRNEKCKTSYTVNKGYAFRV